MKQQDTEDKPLSAHLDELRGVLWRCIIVWLVCSVVALFCKETLFSIIFAPTKNDFYLYRWMGLLSDKLQCAALRPSDFTSHLIATELTAQFMTHITVSLAVGLLVSLPYIIAKLYGFVAPALSEHKRRDSVGVVVVSCLLFVTGVLLNYLVIFPFAYRFLSTYQVQANVVNTITISSYISLFLVLSLLMGILFELPMMAYFLAHMGLVSVSTMRHYRKHIFVVILVVAAIITPTGDAVTLLLVALPIYALYLLSILVVSRVEHHRAQK